MGTSPSYRHHRERKTRTKLTFGEKMAVVLIQHIGWFRLSPLDERTGFLRFPCNVPDVPEK